MKIKNVAEELLVGNIIPICEDCSNEILLKCQSKISKTKIVRGQSAKITFEDKEQVKICGFTLQELLMMKILLAYWIITQY